MRCFLGTYIEGVVLARMRELFGRGLGFVQWTDRDYAAAV
jgi:hypothetical protein